MELRAAVLTTLAAAAGLATTACLPACFVAERCFDDGDCPDGTRCDLSQGTCSWECLTDEDCGGVGFACDDHACVFECDEDTVLSCPEGMVSVCGQLCMDIWEASRPDATPTSPGTDSTHATSREGVIPWYATDAVNGMNLEIATEACEASGKRLCAPAEWTALCQGPDRLAYSYGDAYDPVVCNGIDTYCTCEDQDPYPHCYRECGGAFHVMPTGSFPSCTNAWGIFDINGNVWEVVSSDDGLDHYRGGAYNCSDSEALHACTYDATWNPSAKGFRCCADGVVQ